MKISTSFRYQIADYKKSSIIFYAIMLLMLALGTVTVMLAPNFYEESTVAINGAGMTTSIFLFVAAMNCFKESFGFHLQNGVSRRSMFAARLYVTLFICLLFTIMDFLLQLLTIGANNITNGVVQSPSILDMLLSFMPSVKLDFISHQLISILLTYFILLGASGFGYFLTVLFYHLNKTGKIVAGVGIPILLWLILPMIDFAFNLQIYRSIWEVMLFLMGISTQNLMMPMISFFGLFAVSSTVTWLIMRRTVIR